MADGRSGQHGGGGRELSRHILPSSGTMIGVCTGLIGLVKIVETQAGPSRVDEFAALTALLFLFSALASYTSIRFEQYAALSGRLERAADAVFLAGLVAIVGIALFFAFEMI